METHHEPAVRLSQNELLLALIREELKSRKFFNGLLQLGLDNCPYQVQLDEVIMNLVGLTDETNETYDFYFQLIEKHSNEIKRDADSITLAAVKVYQELIQEVGEKNSDTTARG